MSGAITATSGWNRTAKILIIDDDDELRESLSEQLSLHE